MNVAEIERQVSELLCPNPTEEYWTRCIKGADGSSFFAWISERGNGFVPVGWVRDEGLSAELLEMMPSNTILGRRKDGAWMCFQSGSNPFKNAPNQHPDRKTAIALAFIAWKTAPTRSREG